MVEMEMEEVWDVWIGIVCQDSEDMQHRDGILQPLNARFTQEIAQPVIALAKKTCRRGNQRRLSSSGSVRNVEAYHSRWKDRDYQGIFGGFAQKPMCYAAVRVVLAQLNVQYTLCSIGPRQRLGNRRFPSGLRVFIQITTFRSLVRSLFLSLAREAHLPTCANLTSRSLG